MKSGFIPRAFIDHLLSRVDIIALIDERVPLKKSGQSFIACCPFHQEKTPSFHVRPAQQFYHCFGCGVSGNAISFLMEYDRLDFVAAVEALARLQGLSIPYEQSTHARPAKAEVDAYDFLMQVAKVYQKQLRHCAKATEYLQSRGLTGEIARHFGLGFAPDQWQFLNQTFPSQHALLLDTGMVIAKEGGKSYDRFRNRIMFPIRDTRGRVMAFGGRVLGDEQPKYLNSPETPYFAKGKELYGLYEARLANRDMARLLVVEGYMDVLALVQHGLTTVVATLGTATSTGHIETMARFTQSIVFCFDGDRAGRQAAWRALQSALPVLRDNVSLSFLFLPEGEDPDTYIRHYGREAFEHLIEEALALSQFLFQHLSEDCVLSTAEGRAKLMDKALVLFRQIPPSAVRELLLEELLHWTKIPKKTVLSLLKQKPSEPSPQALPAMQSYRLAQSPMRSAMHLLLSYPALSQTIPSELNPAIDELTLPGANLFHSLLARCRQQPEIALGTLLESYRDQPEFPLLLKIVQHVSVELSESERLHEWVAVLKRLLTLERQQRIDALHQASRQRELTSTEKQELLHLLKKNQSS